jgi:hypothetical protein
MNTRKVNIRKKIDRGFLEYFNENLKEEKGLLVQPVDGGLGYQQVSFFIESPVPKENDAKLTTVYTFLAAAIGIKIEPVAVQHVGRSTRYAYVTTSDLPSEVIARKLLDAMSSILTADELLMTSVIEKMNAYRELVAKGEAPGFNNGWLGRG